MPFTTRDLTFTSSTDAHSTGDVVAAPQEIPNWAAGKGGSSKLVSVTLVDESDTGANLDLVFLRASGSIGAESAAFAPADSVAATIEAVINLTSYDDGVNNKVAVLDNINRIMRAAYDSYSIWVGLVARGSITPAAADDISIKLGIEQ